MTSGQRVYERSGQRVYERIGRLSLFRKGQMQGAARTGAERTGSYVSTGSAAATPQMAVHGQAPLGFALPAFGAAGQHPLVVQIDGHDGVSSLDQVVGHAVGFKVRPQQLVGPVVVGRDHIEGIGARELDLKQSVHALPPWSSAALESPAGARASDAPCIPRRP